MDTGIYVKKYSIQEFSFRIGSVKNYCQIKIFYCLKKTKKKKHNYAYYILIKMRLMVKNRDRSSSNN